MRNELVLEPYLDWTLSFTVARPDGIVPTSRHLTLNAGTRRAAYILLPRLQNERTYVWTLMATCPQCYNPYGLTQDYSYGVRPSEIVLCSNCCQGWPCKIDGVANDYAITCDLVPLFRHDPDYRERLINTLRAGLAPIRWDPLEFVLALATVEAALWEWREWLNDR